MTAHQRPDWNPELPSFTFAGEVTDKTTAAFNPTDEFIFPSLFNAGKYLAQPLAQWYLYYAPHERPGGIAMRYADALTGPWTEHPLNPLISNEWPPHYDWVSHISSPDAVWNPAEGQMFLYFHGENSITRFATSHDGVNFTYGGTAVQNSDGPSQTTESSYARVFTHPDPDARYRFAMFYMQNWTDNVRRIAVAESVDGRTWDVRPEPLIVPGDRERNNVSAADLWHHQGQDYVVYHGGCGHIYARTIDATFSELSEAVTLYEPSGVGVDAERAAAPQIVTEDGETFLFFEAGHRLGATIGWARSGSHSVQ